VNVPSSRSYRNGKRGRHKHATSDETRAWERDHLIPERPSWMDEDTYRRLARLRSTL
jgi:hypothetical protein